MNKMQIACQQNSLIIFSSFKKKTKKNSIINKIKNKSFKHPTAKEKTYAMYVTLQ